MNAKEADLGPTEKIARASRFKHVTLLRCSL